jgi:Uma2 family endonuclease
MTTALPTPDQRIIFSPTDQRLPPTDQRMYLASTWEQFKGIQAVAGGQERIRLGYVDGQIEMVQKGHRHTFLETVIGLLVTKFLLSRQVAFVSSAMTWQKREGLAVAQADWALSFGEVKQGKPIPDLSIEIVPETGWPLVHKYEVLGTPEVWFWQNDRLALYHRRELNYERIDRSELESLQDLDIALVERCVLQAEEDFVAGVSLFESYCREQSQEATQE